MNPRLLDSASRAVEGLNPCQLIPTNALVLIYNTALETFLKPTPSSATAFRMLPLQTTFSVV